MNLTMTVKWKATSTFTTWKVPVSEHTSKDDLGRFALKCMEFHQLICLIASLQGDVIIKGLQSRGTHFEQVNTWHVC